MLNTKKETVPPNTRAISLEIKPGPESFLHRLDPRAKLLAAFLFILTVALSQTFALPIAALAISLMVALLSRLDLRYMGRRALMVNIFVIFLWAFLPWQLTWQNGLSLSFQIKGLVLAALITLKVNAIFLVLMGLLGTSPVNDFFHALAHLKLPAKLVTLFLLFYRYVHVINNEYLRLRWAMRVRGFKARTNWHTYRSMAQLLGMLLVRSMDRAERVYQAMLCRGFKGTFWLLDHFSWRRADTAFCLISAMIIFGLTLMEWRPWLWS